MYKYFALILGLFLISCNNGGNKNSNKNVLNATIDGIDDGTAVYLSELGDGNQPKPLDTVEVQDGKITVDLPEVDFQTLNIMRVENLQGDVLFVNENKEVTVAIKDKDNLRGANIEGGDANQVFAKYMSHINSNNEEMMELRSHYSENEMKDPEIMAELQSKQQELQQNTQELQKSLVKDNPGELPAVLILSDLMRSQSVADDELDDLFDGLSDEVQNTGIGKQIGQQLTALQQKDQQQSPQGNQPAVKVGDKAPNFSAPTPEGEELALEDALGEYTLVDFWAAWCKPCRAENPNIVKVYEKYHDKGFNVLGVSLDRNEKSWLQAIEKDELEWPQISNLKFWQDPIAKEWNIKAIPASFILDKDGVVVATNVRGPALEKKVKELLDE